MKSAHIAKVSGRDLSISTKQSIEICNFIRGKDLEKAKNILKDVIEKKVAIPFRRFNKDMGHKRGRISSGRFPKNACSEILRLLNSVEGNAHDKGLDTKNLIIKSVKADRASAPWHYGRFFRRKMKRTHVEVIVEEKEQKKEKTENKK